MRKSMGKKGRISPLPPHPVPFFHVQRDGQDESVFEKSFPPAVRHSLWKAFFKHALVSRLCSGTEFRI